MATYAVILPAAGSSSRYGSNKLFATLAGKLVLRHTLEAWQRQTADCAAIVLATPQGGKWTDIPPELERQLGQIKNLRLIPGGANRAQSVYNALQAVPVEIEWVAVHDAARPLISDQLIATVFAAAQKHGAAAPALAVHLTIKEADGPLPAPIKATVPRHRLWAMQTPQFARRDALLNGFAKCPIPLDQVTDDVQLLELAGHPAWLVEGEQRNIKITTPMDIRLAEIFLAEQ